MTVFVSTYRCGTVPDLHRIPCYRASTEAHQAGKTHYIVVGYIVNTKYGVVVAVVGAIKGFVGFEAAIGCET